MFPLIMGLFFAVVISIAVIVVVVRILFDLFRDGWFDCLVPVAAVVIIGALFFWYISPNIEMERVDY